MNAILLCYANGENKENISKSATFLDKIKIQNRNHGIKSQLKQESKNSKNSRENINLFYNRTMLRNDFHFLSKSSVFVAIFHLCKFTYRILVTYNQCSSQTHQLPLVQKLHLRNKSFLSRLLLKAFKLLSSFGMLVFAVLTVIGSSQYMFKLVESKESQMIKKIRIYKQNRNNCVANRNQ